MPKFFVESLESDLITLKAPGHNYRTVFRAGSPSAIPPTGEPVRGVIHANAWKIEAVSLGGNYVEPLYGRPRRMQGVVLEVHAPTNELTVKTPFEVRVKLPDRYPAANFGPGTRVGFDCLDIPTFEPAVS